MAERCLFRKKQNLPFTAVQFDLELESFHYQKWNDRQTCKRGDWLVNNDNDIYTIDRDYFQAYYQKISPGVYEKTGGVWAEVAQQPGAIKTKEGSSAYIAGDYLVFDRQTGGIGYAVGKVNFEKMYDKVDEKSFLTEKQKEYINQIQIEIRKCKSGSLRNKLAFYILQPTSFLTAALITVFTPFVNDKVITLKWVVAVLGGITAFLTGFLTCFKFQTTWLKQEKVGRELDSNLVQFHAGAGGYRDVQNAYRLLVENCERIRNG